MKNTAQTLELVEEMKNYLYGWDFELDENIDLEEKYSQRVKAVGEFNFVVCLFENYSDSTNVIALMLNFLFIWKDFDYHDWHNLLYIFAEDNSIIIYHFFWFCGGVLGINIGQVIQDDKQVPEEARNYLKIRFPKGTPKQIYLLDSFEENNIEPATLWRRFKEQGAPMNVDV